MCILLFFIPFPFFLFFVFGFCLIVFSIGFCLIFSPPFPPAFPLSLLHFLAQGKVKVVSENYTTSYTCPSPGYDCHVAAGRNNVPSKTNPYQAFMQSQVQICSPTLTQVPCSFLSMFFYICVSLLTPVLRVWSVRWQYCRAAQADLSVRPHRLPVQGA